MTAEESSNQDENRIVVNGYTAEYSDMWDEWHITHPIIGFCTWFKKKEDALEYLDRC